MGPLPRWLTAATFNRRGAITLEPNIGNVAGGGTAERHDCGAGGSAIVTGIRAERSTGGTLVAAVSGKLDQVERARLRALLAQPP
jgi:hypothetical protein